MGTKRGGPYTGFRTELDAPVFTDEHGNVAGSPDELTKLTKGSNYIENQFQKQFGVACGNCEQINCLCPESGGKDFDLKRQFPGRNRFASFCG